MTWYQDCAQLILLIERRMVEQRAAALAGTAMRPVEFNPSVDLTTSIGSALRGQIEHLVATAERLQRPWAALAGAHQPAQDVARRTTRRPTP